jgi:hypothetical protein
MVCSKPARFFLMIYNSLFLILGALLLGVGVWSKVDKNFGSIWSRVRAEKFVEAADLEALSWIMIIIGLFTIALGIIGFLGSLNKSRSLLSLYLIILTVLFFGKIAGVYYSISFKANFDSKFAVFMNKTFTKSVVDNDRVSKETMDTFQSFFDCCGVNGPSDYNQSVLPASCYESQNSTAANNRSPFANGCSSQIMKYVDTRLPYISSALIIVLIVEFSAIVFSTCLCSKKKFDYDSF